MKKLIILFAIALASVSNFTACSNDDDSSSSSSVVGKWNFSKMSAIVDGVTSPEVDYDDNEPGCPKDYVEFKTGGVFIRGDYSGSTCVLNSFQGTWVESGSTLTITEGSDVFTAQVVSVTPSTLQLKSVETVDSVTVTLIMTFTKA